MTGNDLRQKLDRIDRKILTILQSDGRITKLALAQAVNLSASACLERLKRLEDSGMVEGYRAELDIRRLARSTIVYAEVALARHETGDFQRFETAVRNMPEIVECHATGGGVDYIIKFVCRDIQHYQNVIDELLAAKVGIGRYFTYVVTKPVKAFAGWPLNALLDAPET